MIDKQTQNAINEHIAQLILNFLKAPSDFYTIYNRLTKGGSTYAVTTIKKVLRDSSHFETINRNGITLYAPCTPASSNVEKRSPKPHVPQSTAKPPIAKTQLDVTFIEKCVTAVLRSHDGPMAEREMMEELQRRFPDINMRLVVPRINMKKQQFERYWALREKPDGISVSSQAESQSVSNSPNTTKQELDTIKEKTDVEIDRNDFESHIREFRKFVDKYCRYPFSTGGDEEMALWRWHKSVNEGRLSVADNEKKQFNQMEEEYAHQAIPRSYNECEFKDKCHEFMVFIVENHILPSASNGAELYNWFKRVYKQVYDDHRAIYLKELIYYITSYGFAFP